MRVSMSLRSRSIPLRSSNASLLRAVFALLGLGSASCSSSMTARRACFRCTALTRSSKISRCSPSKPFSSYLRRFSRRVAASAAPPVGGTLPGSTYPMLPLGSIRPPQYRNRSCRFCFSWSRSLPLGRSGWARRLRASSASSSAKISRAGLLHGMGGAGHCLGSSMSRLGAAARGTRTTAFGAAGFAFGGGCQRVAGVASCG
mmetsp:Transcript_39604/g.81058  ORF Transcript_39604/g.81058 Transcript_39604/m.81058 type:complete len:202 (+) Transcript_39604:168-773(+)